MSLLDRLGVRRAPDITAASVDQVAPYAATAPTLHLASPWALPGDLAEVIAPDIFGTAAENLPLTRARAMQVPSVARARHIVAGTIARVPMRAYPLRGTEPLPDDQQPVWLHRTDSLMHPWHRALWTADDLLFYGFSLWRRTNTMQADRNTPLHCDRIPFAQWKIDPNTGQVFVNERPVSRSSVHLILGPHEGLLSFAAATIRHAANLQAASDKAAATPAAQIDLHQTAGEPLTDPQIDSLIERWSKARRGINGGVAYSNASIEVRELAAVSEHLLIEGRNAAAVDVARAVGIPASRIDATTEGSLTYSTTADNARELIDYGLSMYMGAMSASCSTNDLTPNGTRIAFDLEEALPTAGLTVRDGQDVPSGTDAGRATPDKEGIA